MQPLISIITPSLNRAHMIQAAIKSVLNQNYSNVEHIIMDGGSSDGTIDMLKNYKHLKVVVKKDKNLYDAINQGIELAEGEIIGHLNTDDFYEPNCFKIIVEQFEKNQDCDSVCGEAIVFEENEVGKVYIKQKFIEKRFLTLDWDNIAYGMPIINARFFKKSVYQKIGGYDIRYPLGADREFLLRAKLSGLQTAVLDSIVYHYRHHAGSLTINNKRIVDKVPELNSEYLAIINQYKTTLHLPKEIYNLCRRWNTWMTGYTFLECLRNGYSKEAFQFLKKGFQEDNLFLLRYLAQRLKQKSILC